MLRRTLRSLCRPRLTKDILRSTGNWRIKSPSPPGVYYSAVISPQVRNGSTANSADVASKDRTYKNTNLFNLMSLKGQTVVITGGGRGIGLALGYAVAQAGGNVAAIDTLDTPHADFAGLNDLGIKAKIYKADVTDHSQITSTFKQISEDFGSIDGCVTAAGIIVDKPFLEHGWEETTRLQAVNTTGTFFCAQEAAKHMRQQDTKGSIVMISSVTATAAIPSQYLSAYGATKAYVKGLGVHLGVELAPYGIRVNTISPGYIMTDMARKVGELHPELLELFSTAPPIRRPGEMTDLMAAAVYFLSDAAAYTTGADLLITGGLHGGRIH